MAIKHYQTMKVYFEVTNHCNFRCDFCPINVTKRKPQHMEFSLFEKGIEDIVKYRIAPKVGFHVLGEPMMYPRIYDAVSLASHQGLVTEMHTNGSLLTQDRIQSLLDSNLDLLCVSLQIMDPIEHECRGTRMPFEVYYQRVMDAVRQINASRSRTNVMLCAMNTSTRRFFDIDTRMRIKGNKRTFRGDLVNFLNDLYTAIDTNVGQDEVAAAIGRLNLDKPHVVQLSEHVSVYVQPFADWGNAFSTRKVFPTRIGYCGYALKNVGILADGKVTICCADYDGKACLGDLHTQSLNTILLNEKAASIRQGFEQNRIVHPYCQHCMGGSNPLKALVKGLGSIYLFRWLDFQPGGDLKEEALLPA